jgi:oligopeptide/dipeptide ABC transporter ATP-binding protein
VSIQAQVLNLMIALQRDRGLTYLFVTHDLDVARHISQRTAVLYLGRVVEYAPTGEIFSHPLHPYTQALVKAAPRLSTKRKAITPALTGDIPTPSTGRRAATSTRALRWPCRSAGNQAALRNAWTPLGRLATARPGDRQPAAIRTA